MEKEDSPGGELAPKTAGEKLKNTVSWGGASRANPMSTGAARLIFSADSSVIRLQVLSLDVELSGCVFPVGREHFPAFEQQCFSVEFVSSHGNMKKRGQDWQPPQSSVVVTRNTSQRRKIITKESMTDSAFPLIAGVQQPQPVRNHQQRNSHVRGNRRPQ
jgi:hypothetical protein